MGLFLLSYIGIDKLVVLSDPCLDFYVRKTVGLFFFTSACNLTYIEVFLISLPHGSGYLCLILHYISDMICFTFFLKSRKKFRTIVTASSRVDKFSKSDIIVSPSILSANFAKLGEQVLFRISDLCCYKC